MCTCAPPERTNETNKPENNTILLAEQHYFLPLLREPRGARQELRNLIRIILDSQFFFFLTITIKMGSLLLASAGDRRRTIIRLLLLPRSLLLLQSVLFAFLLEYFAGISADFGGRKTLFCPQISEERVKNMHNSTTTLARSFRKVRFSVFTTIQNDCF